MEQQLTTDKQSVTLLVAERAEAVCGDSAPLSLFSLPALILLKKKKITAFSPGFSASFLDDARVSFFQQCHTL